MTTRNPFDSANLTILGEIKEYRDRARKAKPVPQGTEKLTAADARTKIAAMTEQERRDLFDRIGPEKISKILGL